jgi:hypothetical protein
VNVRTFEFHRDADVTGVSGTGIVADGVAFDDGVTVVRWRGERRSTVVWPSAVAVMVEQFAQHLQAAAGRRAAVASATELVDDREIDEHAIESAAIVRAEFDAAGGADRA